MKRRLRSHTVVDTDQSCSDAFAALPAELLPLIIDAACSASNDPFYTLYRQLAPVCQHWHSLCARVNVLSATTNAYWSDIVLRPPDPRGPLPLKRTLCWDSDAIVHSMKHVLCLACGVSCHCLGRGINGPHFGVVVHLAALCGAKLPEQPPPTCHASLTRSQSELDTVLTPMETFALCRAARRYTATNAPEICGHALPTAYSTMGSLFLRLACVERRVLMFVPLTALTRRMSSGKSGRAVTPQTSYSLLRYDGVPLVPSSYDWKVAARVARRPEESDCLSLRTLNALSPSAQIAFLEQHATDIESAIYDPHRIYWCGPRFVDRFVRQLDVIEPRREQDSAMLCDVYNRLCDRICTEQPDSWFTRALAQPHEAARPCPFRK